MKLRFVLLALLAAAPLSAQRTTRVSVGSPNLEADLESYSPSLSADGRYVAFYSEASNLVHGDTNGVEDVFVRNRVNKTTIRVSVASNGMQANAASNVYYYTPGISDDGRYVAFQSSATNLVAGDTNGAEDVFVHDVLTGTTVRASVGTGGVQAASECFNFTLSGDGRHVAFESYAGNLVAGDTNGARDVFVRDLDAGTTVRASLDSNGLEVTRGGAYPALSFDGRIVAFGSESKHIVPGDSNLAFDVFVRDLVAGTVERVSVATGGGEANKGGNYPHLSADGRFVSFESVSTNLAPSDVNASWDVFVHDRLTGTTVACSVSSAGVLGNSSSLTAMISGDGRRVAFKSTASDLVDGDENGLQDIFLHDLDTGITERVSVASDGTEANEYSSLPAISADGRHVAFYSRASNLVRGDTNDEPDLFLRSTEKFRAR